MHCSLQPWSHLAIFILRLQWSQNNPLRGSYPIGKSKDCVGTHLMNTAVAVSSFRHFLLPSLEKFLTGNDIRLVALLGCNFHKLFFRKSIHFFMNSFIQMLLNVRIVLSYLPLPLAMNFVEHKNIIVTWEPRSSTHLLQYLKLIHAQQSHHKPSEHFYQDRVVYHTVYTKFSSCSSVLHCRMTKISPNTPKDVLLN